MTKDQVLRLVRCWWGAKLHACENAADRRLLKEQLNLVMIWIHEHSK
jgi:hypothetical protein